MKILIINGPNLNMLGQREQKHYGTLTLKQLNNLIKKSYPEIKFKFVQSNSESKIINYIHHANKYDGLIINAAGFTHTSISIMDALNIIKIPKISVHLSDLSKREDFRQTDYIKLAVNQVFMGKKEQTYLDAINYLLDKKS